MESILNELIKDKALCEIYADVDDTSKFALGYIIACNGDHTVVEHYDPYGHYDGIGCFMTETIFDVATETEYISALSKLIDYHNEKSNYVVDAVGEINKLLAVIKSEKRICQIELCESKDYIEGYIDSFNDNIVKISKVGKYGQNDGKAIVRRDTISYITFDSTDTVKLEILRK